MNLFELRKNFVETSGRYDLIKDTTTYEDDGANYYISIAQKYLDRRSIVENNTTQIIRHIKQGDFYVLFKNNISLLDVRFFDIDNTNIELERVGLKRYYSLFGNQENLEGDVFYYTLLNLTTSPDQKNTNFLDLDGFNSLFDVTLNINYDQTGLAFLPIAAQEYTLKIAGKFLSTELINDSDVSFWSVNYPEILIRAALLQLEINNRNTEGAKDWVRAIDDNLNDIEKDIVDFETSNITQLEG
jgi:hypothetical protein